MNSFVISGKESVAFSGTGENILSGAPLILTTTLSGKTSKVCFSVYWDIARRTSIPPKKSRFFINSWNRKIFFWIFFRNEIVINGCKTSLPINKKLFR